MGIKDKICDLIDTLKNRDNLGSAAIVVYADCVDDLDGDLVETLSANGYKTLADGAKMPTLTYGDSGKAVTMLQAALNYLGFDCGAVDGIFGGNTQAAVNRYKDMHGMAPDGVADGEIWKSFFERL